jgi:hypothetical protein
MFTLKLTDEQKQSAWSFVQNNNIANRSEWNGDKTQQYAGVLAEIAFADVMKLPRPIQNGFDHGIDFVMFNKKLDIKTVIRNVDFKYDYGCWVKTSQLDYETDIYIFSSINKKKSEISFIGLIKKELVKEVGILFKLGDKSLRKDGTSMTLGTSSYEVLSKDLCLFSHPNDIISWLNPPNKPISSPYTAL